jgi:hypothetical protein
MPAIRIPHQYQSQSALQAINAPMAIDSSGPNVASRPSLMGVGQTQDPTRLKSGSGIKRLLVPALMATVLSVIGIAVVMRTTAPEPRIERHPVKPAGPVKSVKWEVKSDPPAEIVRVSDGVVLGMTPWTKDQPAGVGKMGVTLRRSGYIDKQVLLDLERDTSETVTLDKVPGASEPTGNEPAGAKPAKKPKKPKKPKTGKEARKDDDSDLLTPVH